MKISLFGCMITTLMMSSVTPAFAQSVSDFDNDNLQDLTQYGYVDPTHVVPDALLRTALAYYDAHVRKIANKTYLSVVNFSASSADPRFFIIDMKSGAVTQLHVAHGKGSDPSNSGFATRFSNISGSDESSLGFYLTAEVFTGKDGLGLRLDGLSATNSKVRSREIVVHGAGYVYDDDIRAGRSLGCFAFSLKDYVQVIDKLKNGSLIYAGLIP